MSSIIRATTTSGLQIAPDNSGSLILQTNGTTAAVTLDTSQNTTFAGKVTSAGALTLASNGTTTAITIDTSQNVGIGTASPAATLNISTASSNATLLQEVARLSTTGRSGAGGTASRGTLLSFSDASNFTLTSAVGGIRQNSDADFNGALAFYTSGTGASQATSVSQLTERMRIDSSGNVLVGTTSGGSGKLRVSGAGDAFATSYTSPSAGYFFSSNSADTTCVEIYQGRYNRAGLALSANNTGTVTQIDFYQTGTARGSISTNNSTTAYNTSSDYRLKDNIVPMTGALDKVALLKPVTYTWKQDGSDGQGFIAHELQEIVPNAVTGEKDAVETYTDEDGIEQTRIKPQGIDTSFLVATLTAAIQEQQTIINDLKARVETLEAKLG
jgi:hypothetical protein